MEFGVLDFEREAVVNYNKANSLEAFAMIRLKVVMKSEGFQFNNSNRMSYINSWIEHIEETSEETFQGSITDEIADNLTYCNIHLQKRLPNSFTWIPLSSEDKKVFYQTIVDKLEEVLRLKAIVDNF